MRFLLLTMLCVFSGAAYAQDHVGARRCKSCHEPQYAQWKQSGHANALARLSKLQQKDPTCRTCHTMVPNSVDATLAGVQCETCHGAGRLYEAEHVMRDEELAKLLGLQPVTEVTCAPCHTKDAPGVEPFDYAAKLELVRHVKKETGE